MTPEREKYYTRETVVIINGTSRGIATELWVKVVNKRHLAIALLESGHILIEQPAFEVILRRFLRSRAKPPGRSLVEVLESVKEV